MAFGQPKDDYEAQNHARTLVEAEQIKADPKKFHKAMKHVKKTHKAHKALMDHAKAMGKGEDNGGY